MDMENFEYKYAGIVHSESRGGIVAFKLERTDGGQFCAMLEVEDAKRLLEDLSEQVRIADKKSG